MSVRRITTEWWTQLIEHLAEEGELDLPDKPPAGPDEPEKTIRAALEAADAFDHEEEHLAVREVSVEHVDWGVNDWCLLADLTYRVWPGCRTIRIEHQNFCDAASLLACDIDRVVIEEDIQTTWPFAADELVQYANMDEPDALYWASSFVADVSKRGRPKRVEVVESFNCHMPFRKQTLAEKETTVEKKDPAAGD